jgi:RNA-directed DNA polymerase
LQTYPVLRQMISAWLTAGALDGYAYSSSATGIAQGGVLSPLLMNVALHGMEAVVTQGTTGGRAREQPLLVRFADDFVILHPDLKELQQAVRRVRQWLATIGLRLHAGKTRITHTLTPYQGQAGFDFLSFHICQEQVENSAVKKRGQEHAPGLRSAPALPMRRATQPNSSFRVKTIVTPSQNASKRHLAAIDQRLQQLQTAPQARVIEELNPLIRGWVSYYNGLVEASVMRRYDDLLEQRLLQWASKRHPGKEHEWLLARYWQRVGQHKRVFATHDGLALRSYRQTSILRS